jgi:two-component system response regulator PhoP
MHLPDDSSRDSIARVAVVEDDAELRDRILVPGLRGFGFDTIGLDSAEALYRYIIGNRLDLVILDVGLPDADGFSAARHLRTVMGMNVGIMMLTGRVTGSDMVQGFGNGADLYMPKPFEIEVVAAGLHSLLRRLQSTVTSDQEAVSGQHEWRVESDGWCLRAPNGKRVALTNAERCVVRLLGAARGEAVARETLIAALTDDVETFDPHRLEMLVHRLRRKTEAQTGEPLPLRSARGAGYALLRNA